MKIFDPEQNKKVEVITKVFKLKMKPGTKGTQDDPHRPLIADILGSKPHKWEVHEGNGTIKVSAQPLALAEIGLTHKEIK